MEKTAGGKEEKSKTANNLCNIIPTVCDNYITCTVRILQGVGRTVLT